MRLCVPVKTKLTAAGFCFLTVFGFCIFYSKATYGTGELIFRACSFVCAIFIIFASIYHNTSLQLLWGRGLIFFALLLLALILFGIFHGLAILWSCMALIASSLAGFLLLLDSDVKAYRSGLMAKR